MTPEKQLKIASVGLGWVTTHRHIPVIQRNSRYELLGVIDRSPGRAKEVAQTFGCKNYAETDNLEDVQWLSEIDAINVGTSPMTHASLIQEALSLGKHVITEKPFTMTVAEGESLVETAKQNGLVLAIVHNFQFARSTLALKDDLVKGKLGEIRSVRAVQWGNPRRRLPTWYEELPLGLFYDESPHLLYLLREFASKQITLERVDVIPSTHNKATPHILDATFSGRENSIPMTLHLNFESPISEWYLIVFGEEQLGMVDIFRDIYVRLPNDEAHVTKTVLRTSLFATLQHWSQHFTSGFQHLRGTLFYGNEIVFNRFAEAVINGTDLQDISAEDALAVLKMQHDIIQRSRNGDN